MLWGGTAIWLNDLFVHIYEEDQLRPLLLQVLEHATVAESVNYWLRYTIAVLANALYGREVFAVR